MKLEPEQQPLFTLKSPRNTLGYRHIESAYDDFETEVLLPHRLSREGPIMAEGDFNGDGMLDVYIGGSAGQSGALFMQIEDGKFQGFIPEAFKQDEKYEDGGALWLDVDSDGDQDLYVSSGSNEFNDDPEMYQDRLYMNMGQGLLVKSFGRLPEIQSSGGKILKHDLDGDGDQDLVVLGRQSGFGYLRRSENVILENTGMTYEHRLDWFGNARFQGHVTDGEFADITGDGIEELVVIREWGALSVFEKNDRGWTEKPYFDVESGWWQSLEVADMDNDGDLDLVVGNWGENNKFHPSKEKPLHVFVGNMDDNKTWDIVLAKEKSSGLLPVRGRECSSEQVPLILNKFPTYEAFAIANLNEIYSEEKLNKSLHSFTETMSSGIYLNEGDGFRFVAFPKEAQISPIKDMVLTDLNRDGNMDIVFTGNHFPAEVETVRYDAGIGGVLTGNGDGTMTWMPLSESGFYTPEDTRSLVRVPLKKGREYWLVGVNSGLVKVLERRVN